MRQQNILKLKNKDCIAKEVNYDQDTLGVRIPKHWIFQIIQLLKVPIITTSVNKAGEAYMTSLEDLDPKIKGHVSFCLYEREKKGSPSKIVNLTGKEIQVRER